MFDTVSSMRQVSLALAEPKRPGGRKGRSGRKSSSPGRPKVSHHARPWHDESKPVHVTLRVRGDLGSLRRRCVLRAIAGAFFEATERGESFRVAHFSVQPDHLHLIVEATSKRSLGRGMQSLNTRLAKRINGALGRRGPVFADRYHGRALETPTEVRRAIAYVLNNHRKHPESHAEPGTRDYQGVDPCSSARWFTGWGTPISGDHGRAPVSAPRTWLLAKGWQRAGGPLRRDEGPAITR